MTVKWLNVLCYVLLNIYQVKNQILPADKKYDEDSTGYDMDKDSDTLARLSLDQLIYLKQAVASGRLKDAWETANRKIMNKKWKWPNKRDDGWWPEEEEHYYKPAYEHEKKGKGYGVEKFFFTAISILSFLAFGGYILCMILYALRRNQTVMVVTTTMATTAAGRRKRSIIKDTSLPIDSTLDETYSALIALSEAYAKYENFSRSGLSVQP